MGVRYLASTDCFSVIMLVVLICVTAKLTMLFLKISNDNRFLKKLDKTLGKYEFKSLKREEYHHDHKRNLFNRKLFDWNKVTTIDFKRCYRLSSGELDCFISDVQELSHEEGKIDPRVTEIVKKDRYWNFYCAIETSFDNELAIYHQERCIPLDVFGKSLEIVNPVENFKGIFIVKSTNGELTEITIPVEIQKIFLRYYDGYPIKAKNLSKTSAYVFLGKKEISISAPYIQNNHSVILLFELGVELVQYFKEITEDI